MKAPRFSVLVVDDDATQRLILKRLLEGGGRFQVRTAADGVEALRLVENDPFDLVILDITMPGMSGLEVLSRLRQTWEPDELPVIMATAKSESRDMVEAFNQGANDYVTKPFELPIVLARVKALLRTRESARTAARPMPFFTSLRQLETGTVLEDKYRIDHLIGSGSNGAVYSGLHLGLERPVAIKLLYTSLSDDERALADFHREGISACRIDHPNAVGVHDFTATRFGVAFLVMELLRGRTLREELDLEGRLSPVRAAEILFPICDVLTEAHEKGVLHRDIKPQNIFLHECRRGEVVKVLDFGLAKLLEESAGDDPTVDGLAGTLAYIAPERVSAEPYDGRSDVYSVGVMLYEMLTGHQPFEGHQGNPLQLMMMHVQKTPPPPSYWRPELDPAVEAVILRSLAKNPQHRPSANDLKLALARALDIEVSDSGKVVLREEDGQILHNLLRQELRRTA